MSGWSSRARALVLVLVFVLADVSASLRADSVVLLDGTEMTGTVIDLQADVLHLRDERGSQVVVPRARIARIVFEPAAPKVKVEVRAVAGDDEMDLLLNGDPIQERVGSLGASWADVSDKLVQGNNRFDVLVRNERASWSYRWELRINGKMTVFSCGQPGVKGKGCTCCGRTGNETGDVGSLDPVWVHLDRAAGLAEITGR